MKVWHIQIWFGNREVITIVITLLLAYIANIERLYGWYIIYIADIKWLYCWHISQILINLLLVYITDIRRHYCWRISQISNYLIAGIYHINQLTLLMAYIADIDRLCCWYILQTLIASIPPMDLPFLKKPPSGKEDTPLFCINGKNKTRIRSNCFKQFVINYLELEAVMLSGSELIAD